MKKGVPRTRRHGRSAPRVPWTAADDAVVIKGGLQKQVAKQLNRTVDEVSERRVLLGIKSPFAPAPCMKVGTDAMKAKQPLVARQKVLLKRRAEIRRQIKKIEEKTLLTDPQHGALLPDLAGTNLRPLIRWAIAHAPKEFTVDDVVEILISLGDQFERTRLLFAHQIQVYLRGQKEVCVLRRAGGKGQSFVYGKRLGGFVADV